MRNGKGGKHKGKRVSGQIRGRNEKNKRVMQTEDSQKVIRRFFEALYHLKSLRIIRGKQTFTARFGINRWNMNSLENNPASGIFQTAWLTYLVKGYGVSAEWLLTGRGEIMERGTRKSKGEVT